MLHGQNWLHGIESLTTFFAIAVIISGVIAGIIAMVQYATTREHWFVSANVRWRIAVTAYLMVAVILHFAFHTGRSWMIYWFIGYAVSHCVIEVVRWTGKIVPSRQ